MSEAFTKKNIKLSLEFDAYIARHPDLFNDIPKGAYIIITVSGDKKFNSYSISMVKKLKRKKIIEAHKESDKWSLKPLQLQSA